MITQVKAKIANPQENGTNYGQAKELVSAYSLIARKAGKMSEAVTVRVYMGRSRSASTVYATVWVRPGKDGKPWLSGTGSAGGYGYHKESAAIADAISSAGIELYGDPYCRPDEKPDFKKRVHFGGTGDSNYHGILAAIARASGFNVAGSLLIRH